MNDRLHIADTDLALYAMGALPADEAAPVEAHLLVCARCKEEVRQSTLALAAYAQTTPEVEMPAGAKDRFMARLESTPQTAPAAQATPATPAKVEPAEKPAGFWQQFWGTGGARWSTALAASLAILLMGVGIDDMRKSVQLVPLREKARQGAIDSAQLAELMELLTSPQAKRVALHPGPVSAPPPEGRVVYAARTGKLMLTASNLHPLPAGKTYELWILQPGGKAPLPAGTFVPDGAGNATMILADAPAGLAVQGFGVTIENAGGSQTPTLPIVLSGL
jgi:anti-sigma-K factor RskA